MKKRKMDMEEAGSSTPEDEHDPSENSVSKASNLILEQDRFLPIANINRIMKNAIPREGKLSKEAKECVQECITEFLLFITSEASERCANEKRKTITGEDLIVAFQTLGFDDYVDPLREFLTKYREANKVQSNKGVENEEDIVEYDDNVMQPHTSGSTGASVHCESVGDASGNGMVYSAAVQPQQHYMVSGPPQPLQQPQMLQQPQHQPAMLQSMQIYVDPSSGQHYVTVQNGDGVQSLLPVNVTPMTAPTIQVAPAPTIQVASAPPPPVTHLEVPSSAAPPYSTAHHAMHNKRVPQNSQPTVTPRGRRAKNAKGAAAVATSGETLPSGEQSVRHFLQEEFKRKQQLDTSNPPDIPPQV